MRQLCFLFSLISITTLFLSCNKGAAIETPNAKTTEIGTFIPLTEQEYAQFVTLLAQENVRDTVSFNKLVKFVQAEDGGISRKSVLYDAPGSDVVSNDLSLGAITGNSQIYSQDYDFSSQTATIEAMYTVNQTFHIRGNIVQIQVPFRFTVIDNPSLGVNQLVITSVTQSLYNDIQLLPVGLDWGTVTQLNSALNAQGAASFSAFATAQEERTEVLAVNGSIALKTGINLEVFTLGTDLGSGFIISSAKNVYNQYSMTAPRCNINQLYGSVVDGQIVVTSTPSISGAIACTDYGILLDQ